MHHSYDFVIVGLGLAGATLAVTLKRRGQRVAIIDRAQRSTASSVAAGLITPILGKSFKVAWRWDEFWPAAADFYCDLESQTGVGLLASGPALRLFQSAEERDAFREPLDARNVFVDTEFDSDFDTSFRAEFGGFAMAPAARLNVPRYLQVVREMFEAEGSSFVAHVGSLDLLPTGIAVGVTDDRIDAKTVVFCEGSAARENPLFRRIAFDLVKGEVLTVRIPGCTEHRTVHRGIWLAPIGSSRFLAGSTWDWNDLSNTPSDTGRATIEQRLSELLRRPYEVLDHRAAVRPVITGRRPVIGRHPEHADIAFFNGLASRGSLQAPFVAAQLANHLCHGSAIDPEFDLHRFWIDT